MDLNPDMAENQLHCVSESKISGAVWGSGCWPGAVRVELTR